ncbi:hypothetical protein DHW03_15295 [Pedobacter yonginense]|uniref:Uncharacterized protein n=1 Tax=Pedobacter yonginense TaxID=651869 RepID=A0A317EJ84_9SPHI|nr:DUF6520 family protein [Pedobacter yonginense]PWS26159.1 hypothetical protein DHW03_15295 [Pedobacter yonginense]
MKNLKIKLPFLALLLGLGIVFVQSAFTSVTDKRANTYWRYNPTDPALSYSGSNYSQITVPIDQVECPTGLDAICVFEAPETVTSTTLLDSYLHTNFADANAVNNSSNVIRKKEGD